MRLGLLFAALAALSAPMAATGDPAAAEKTPASVLALGRSGRTDFLVRLDGESLRPISRRLPLAGHAYAWSFSPDGTRVALGVDRALGLRIVDVGRLKRLARIRTWNGDIYALAWLTARRIVGVEDTGLFAVDPEARRRIRVPYLDGEVFRMLRTGSALTVLVGRERAIGAARLVTIGADCKPRTVTLDRIRAGVVFDEETMRGERRLPGLAFDPAGRVFVVGSGGDPVAEVDLATLAVTYHEPAERRSFLTRLRDWIEPAAAAKMPLAGSSRHALWLGDGGIAVWGEDSVPAGVERVETTPFGLSIVDTKDWTVEVVDRSTTEVARVEDTLLATDISIGSSGLTAYTLGGERRFRLFDGTSVLVSQSLGSTAFVTPSGERIHAVDVTTGRVLRRLRTMPRLLTP